MVDSAFADADERLASQSEDADVARMIERRQRLLGGAYRLFYDRPVHIVRGAGSWLYDAAGHKYLDVYNNVASVGHAHPHIVEAIRRQASTLSTHTRYLDNTILDYAERLIATFPGPLSRIMFTCSGSEANDLAARIARSVTGGEGIIVTSNAYHGVTSDVAAFSPSLGAKVPLGRHVRTVPPPDSYRMQDDGGSTFANHVQLAAEDLQRHGIQPAALFCDSIFSSDGIFADLADVLAPAVQMIRNAGGSLLRIKFNRDLGEPETACGDSVGTILCQTWLRSGANGQRTSDRGRHWQRRGHGSFWSRIPLLQHLRRQPCFLCGRSRRA